MPRVGRAGTGARDFGHQLGLFFVSWSRGRHTGWGGVRSFVCFMSFTFFPEFEIGGCWRWREIQRLSGCHDLRFLWMMAVPAFEGIGGRAEQLTRALATRGNREGGGGTRRPGSALGVCARL